MLGRARRWLYTLSSAHRASILGVLAIPLSVLSYNIAALDLGGGIPHDFSAHDCLHCHYTVPKSGEKGPYRFVAPIDTLCRGCHQDIGGVSHHINFKPRWKPPDFLPLDDKGEITCSTCHDPHMPYKNPATGQKTHFNRGSGKGLWGCNDCHDGGKDAGQGAEEHLRFMHRAHWHPAYSLFTGFDRKPGCRPSSQEEMDRLSMECLGCHDTSDWAGKAKVCSMVFVEGGSGGTTHPIGGNYMQEARKNSELKYAGLDPRLKLFGGSMGCCTCHDPFKPGYLGLRIGSREDYTELCRACHTKLGQ